MIRIVYENDCQSRVVKHLIASDSQSQVGNGSNLQMQMRITFVANGNDLQQGWQGVTGWSGDSVLHLEIFS